MEHPEVAYRLAVARQLELERAVAASRNRAPASSRIGAAIARLRRAASLFARAHAGPVRQRRAQADSPRSISSTR